MINQDACYIVDGYDIKRMFKPIYVKANTAIEKNATYICSINQQINNMQLATKLMDAEKNIIYLYMYNQK
jgi:hypothetical protein